MKKFVRKWGSNRQNLKKIVRESRGSISKIKCFYRPKIGISSLLHSNVKDGIQIQVYNGNNESVKHFSQFISEKVKKISGSISGKVRKNEAQAKQWFSFMYVKRILQLFHAVVIFSILSLASFCLCVITKRFQKLTNFNLTRARKSGDIFRHTHIH